MRVAAGTNGSYRHGVIALRTSSLQTLVVLRPKLVLFGAEIVQVIPRKDATAVSVRKRGLHRVIADLRQLNDVNLALACLQHFLARAMALNFGRR